MPTACIRNETIGGDAPIMAITPAQTQTRARPHRKGPVEVGTTSTRAAGHLAVAARRLLGPVTMVAGATVAAAIRTSMTSLVLRRLMSALFGLIALIAGFAGPAAFADPPIPPLTGRVVDTARVLSSSTVASLTSRLQTFEQQTTNQIVVVTLPDLKGYQIEDWGLALLRGWGIGQKGKNNGVVLVVAPNDRQLRIEVGYGLEGNLPDATAYRIIQDEIIPRFKSGNIDGGVTAGVDAIIATIGGTYKPAAKSLPFLGSTMRFFSANGGFVIFLLIYIAITIYRFSNQSWTRSRRYSSGYFGSSGSGWSSGGGFSGGGGSGGGGGASGRW